MVEAINADRAAFLQGRAFVGATVEENIRLTLLGPTDV